MINNLLKSFSVIIPCYNSQDYIRNALQSIVNTTYPLSKIEVLIIDDGSSDPKDFYKSIENFLLKYPKVFKYFRKDNGNWGSVINYVKKNNLVNNELVCILDSDDKYKSCFFDIVNKKIGDNDVLVTCYTIIQGKIRYKAYPYLFLNRQIKDNQKYTAMAYPACIVYTKKIFNSLSYLQEGVSYQDNVLFFEALKKSKKIRWTSKNASVYWRSRPNNTMMSEFNDEKINAQLLVFSCLKKMGLENHFFWFFFQKGFSKKLIEKNIHLEMNHKIKFTWAPIWLRWLLHVLLFRKIKKIVIYKK